jgi:hypothetical protein
MSLPAKLHRLKRALSWNALFLWKTQFGGVFFVLDSNESLRKNIQSFLTRWKEMIFYSVRIVEMFKICKCPWKKVECSFQIALSYLARLIVVCQINNSSQIPSCYEVITRAAIKFGSSYKMLSNQVPK